MKNKYMEWCIRHHVMRKRILAGLTLTLSVLICCIPIIAHAEIIDSGECGAQGDNLIWTFDSDGTLSISGEGEMADYLWHNNHYEDINTIIISEGVTNIGHYAFGRCTNLTNIIIPDSVTSIGDHAFDECTSLKSIAIPNSITNIGEGAFGGCTALENIVIPDSVTSIDDYVFTNVQLLNLQLSATEYQLYRKICLVIVKFLMMLSFRLVLQK